MLEPRRIAARAAAEFMAKQRGEEVGETIGYRIRFESKVSSQTRIEVVTEGILARLIQSDPELSGIGAILFDEFHERHLQGDLAGAFALDVQASLRPDLRLVIMSATLDGERIARWFDAPRITSAGRSFPVRVEYPPTRPNEEWPTHLRRTVEAALKATDGDMLVFLAGRREIEQARMALQAVGGIELVPLHGELSLAEQHAALAPAPSGKRRIVLATNIAESSVTLPGIRAVIDTGLAREPRLDPNSGFTRLETVRDLAGLRPISARDVRAASPPVSRIGYGRRVSAANRHGVRKSVRSNCRDWRSISLRGDRTNYAGSIRRPAVRWPARAIC